MLIFATLKSLHGREVGRQLQGDRVFTFDFKVGTEVSVPLRFSRGDSPPNPKPQKCILRAVQTTGGAIFGAEISPFRLVATPLVEFVSLKQG